MRSLAPGVPPPIIMISGKASTKDVIKGLQAGSSDYITKPFQPQARGGGGSTKDVIKRLQAGSSDCVRRQQGEGGGGVYVAVTTSPSPSNHAGTGGGGGVSPSALNHRQGGVGFREGGEPSSLNPPPPNPQP